LTPSSSAANAQSGEVTSQHRRQRLADASISNQDYFQRCIPKALCVQPGALPRQLMSLPYLACVGQSYPENMHKNGVTQNRCQVRQSDIDELFIDKFVGPSPLSARKLYREYVAWTTVKR
jgi:hypothetical protein